MKVIRYFAFTLAVFFSASPSALAMLEGQYSLGVLGGQVGLTGDVADVDKGGGLGLGFVAGYSVTDDLFFNLQYHQADLGKVKHSVFAVGGDFFLDGPEAMRPYVAAGLGLLSNTIDFGMSGLQKLEPSSQAFALYLGAGFDFQLTRAMSFGLQGRYHFAFEAEESVEGETRPIVQNTYSVMARWIYTFGSSTTW